MGRRARQGPGPTHHPGARKQGLAQARSRQLDQQPDPPLPQPQGHNVTTASALMEKDIMQLAMIGLGRMGANMVRRLIKGGHQCVVFDKSPKAVADLAREKAVAAASL